jgi:hypothetical protein
MPIPFAYLCQPGQYVSGPTYLFNVNNVPTGASILSEPKNIWDYQFDYGIFLRSPSWQRAATRIFSQIPEIIMILAALNGAIGWNL